MSQNNPFEPFHEDAVPNTAEEQAIVMERGHQFWRDKILDFRDNEVLYMAGNARPAPHFCWPPDSETRLQQEWESSQTKRDLEQLAGGQYSEGFRSVWRACLHVMECSPNHVLSLQGSLRYERARDHQPLEFWNDEFCKALRRLIVHPIWQRQPSILAMVLRYYVICKWDYRGHAVFRTGAHVRCPALHDFNMLLEAQPQVFEPYYIIHGRIHSQFLAMGAKLSPLSHLMYRIGQIAPERRLQNATQLSSGPPITSEMNVTIFGIIIDDLRMITRAINTGGAYQGPLLTTVEFANEVFRHSLTYQNMGQLSLNRAKQLYKRA